MLPKLHKLSVCGEPLTVSPDEKEYGFRGTMIFRYWLKYSVRFKFEKT